MNTHQIFTFSEFLELQSYVEENEFEYIVIDTETNNKIEKLAKLYGAGFCFQDDEAFYIPFVTKEGTSWWRPQEEKIISNWISNQCKTKKVIGHNIIYDVLVLFYNWGVDLTENIYSDTILQKHTVDEERPFALKDVAVKYLGNWANKAQEALYENIKANGGSTIKDQMDMFKADTSVLAEYCCWDVLLTKKLFDIFEAKLIEENTFDLFYKDEIMPLYKEVTIPMKKRGFAVDVEYFKTLNQEIKKEISVLEDEVQKQLCSLTEEFKINLLNKDYPVKKSGSFPKVLAEKFEIPLILGGEEKVSLSKKNIQKLLSHYPDFENFYKWVLGEEELGLDEEDIREVQEYWWLKDNLSEKYIFNLASNNHLKWLFFTKLQETPLGYTDSKEPQVDDDFLESIKSTYPWIQPLVDLKKLSKLNSTYIEGVLEREIDGYIFSSFIQFGPPSGRYASRDPNLQNLPRVKEDDSGLSERVLYYVNSIKKGFVAPKNYKIVNADYSQLEPRAFAEACGDFLLQDVFIKGEDLYGSIAKNIWGLDCTPNEVKKKYPEQRQKAKTIALAVVYGAEAGRISKLMDISYDEAQAIIDDYLNAYSGLKDYMERCNTEVCKKGLIRTKFGRTRHLPEAQKLYKYYGMKLLDSKWAKQKNLGELRWKFKNMLNLSKNFPIQGVASHIVNRAAIAINKEFKKRNIDAQIIAQVHDELTCVAREDQSEIARDIVKYCMENTTKISVPLVAEPLIADNWAEAK